MSEPLMVFESVSKKFRRGERHNSLRDLIPASLRRIASGLKPTGVLCPEEFWALNDVSFEVKPGEALGVIGRNGAGKSTVLKILNRIMKPTDGKCRIRGRVGALIEIAAGFHPDLTGRQNVFLQGAIMGMRRPEIAKKFTDIIEFADIGDFIDTPAKRYSSGMSARLGFAIAAHLDPEVLLIDEVLSVGDFAFQQKAFDRLQEIVERGVPTIIVSHQLERLTSLCTHVIVLDHGRVVHYGGAEESIAAYLIEQKSADESGNTTVGMRLLALDVLDRSTRSGERVKVRLCGERNPEDSPRLIKLSLRSSRTGQIIFTTDHVVSGMAQLPSGRFVLEASLQLNVAAGLYLIETSVADPRSRGSVVEGPRRVIEVLEGLPFNGVAQLNAQMRFVR
jgi:ABC-type polysaccharide/polyol phosphate transport system ATPase subunit